MKNIITLNWYSSIQKRGHIDSIDNYIYIFEPSEIVSELLSYPFTMDITTCCICLKGELKGKIDMVPYTLQPSSLLITMPDQILEHEYCSEDFSAIFVFMTKRFTDSLNLPESFSTFLFIRNNPHIQLTDSQLVAMKTYCAMLRKVIRTKDNLNRMKVIKHLTIAFFYGIGYYFHSSSDSIEKSRNNMLVEDFLKLIRIHYKKERRMEFYAGKLCRSPKYLAQVIKNQSGKSASDWIDDYVILEAKALLKSTNMTVQQISDELNFPTQSFFGKYFKRLVGIPPKQYRSL